MCWIIITTNKEDIKEHLKYQEDRWLDSLWIINKECIYRSVKAKIEWYNEIIDKMKDVKWIHLIHHRKASIWDINLNNAHPFMWKKFILIQNWTMKDFHKETDFEEDVDSHNLLLYIEKNAKNIKWVPKAFDKFKEEFKEEFGIVILADYKWNIIFITDGGRESYIDIEEDKIKLIRNYRIWEKEWYKNKWYIIFDFEWNIISKEFEWEINWEDFKKKISTTRYNSRNDTGLLWVGKKEKDLKEKKEWWEEWNLLELSDIKWEIESYLWDNYDILEYYNEALILTEFLEDRYGVSDTTWYYYIYKEAFPIYYFREKLEEVKQEASHILFNKKKKWE